MDFYCVDNMPVSMMPKFAELCLATRGRYERVALVSDVRALENIEELFATLESMREMGCGHKILYVESDMETIVKRYKETRRRHPLDVGGRGLEDAIRMETRLLAPVREQADEILDTTGLTLGQLQRRLYKRFSGGGDEQPLSVNITSFGFKHGLPIEADLVFDVRFMPNPFYVKELNRKNGLDAEVRDYVFSFEQSREFFNRLCDMMEFLLPHYIEEGKRNLVISIGCTGGRHRSVAMSRALTDFLAEHGFPADCTHRDIEKE
jgi:UPF0042 nucleotide-binding protein